MHSSVKQSMLILSLLLFALQNATMAEIQSHYHLNILNSDHVILYQLPIHEDRWCLHWNHSVTGIAVEDCYQIIAEQLKLKSSWQPDFAAGLGHFEGRGTLSEHPQGGYLISEINEPVRDNRLILRVGSKDVAHSIASGNTHINLSDIAAGQRIIIKLASLQH